jgi:hypothetical protein
LVPASMAAIVQIIIGQTPALFNLTPQALDEIQL